MILDTQNFTLLGGEAYPLNKQDMFFSWKNICKVGGQ